MALKDLYEFLKMLWSNEEMREGARLAAILIVILIVIIALICCICNPEISVPIAAFISSLMPDWESIKEFIENVKEWIRGFLPITW